MRRAFDDPGDRRLRSALRQIVFDFGFAAVEFGSAERSFRTAQQFPGSPRLGQAFLRPLGNKIPFDLGEQREQSDHHFCWNILSPVDPDVLFHGPEPDRPFSHGIEQGDDLSDRAAEAGKLADQNQIAGSHGSQQAVELPLAGRAAAGSRKLDEAVNPDVLLAGKLQQSQPLVAGVLPPGGNAKIGYRSRRICHENVGRAALCPHCGGKVERFQRRYPGG